MNKYKLQTTSIWRFPERGSWATHRGDYRGNWSPHIPRNLILKYTKEEDIVLDPFIGSGTTLIECKILNRNGIGVDINKHSISITQNRLNFDVDNNSKQLVLLGNALNLNGIEEDSIDFICTHPPYADIIHYSNSIIDDISLLPYAQFLDSMEMVAKELHRVLKPNHFCSFMIGDIRKHGNVVPLGFLTMQKFIENNFILKEIIIKEQLNCRATEFWETKSQSKNFYLLAHEYIFVLCNI